MRLRKRPSGRFFLLQENNCQDCLVHAVFTLRHHNEPMKLLKRGLDWPKNPRWMRYSILIGWIALILSGCATQPSNQQVSHEGPGVTDASVCRVELNEVPTKGEPDRDEPHRYEAKTAVGLTGLMGRVYAEALGVHLIFSDQSKPRQTDPWPDTKDCVD